MFVRWQHKKRSRPVYGGRGVPGDTAHYASLVHAIYVRGRNPKQIFIAYLSSYLESETKNMFAVADFWHRVDGRLDSLDISTVDRIKAVEAIGRRLPRPTAKDMKAAKQHAAEQMDRLGSSIARVGMVR